MATAVLTGEVSVPVRRDRELLAVGYLGRVGNWLREGF
jgi:hypothetical protein